MKQLYKPLFLITMILFMVSTNAQYRQSPILENVTFDKYGDPITSKTEENLNFEITFSNMNVLLNMQNAMASVQQAAIDRWLGQQETKFLKEMNRQLGTKHTSFKSAQNDFFKNYEKNVVGLEHTGRNIGADHVRAANSLDSQQENFTKDLNTLSEWKLNRNLCKPQGLLHCPEFSSSTVRGTRIVNASQSTLDLLERETLTDFSDREYRSAVNRSWAQGVYKIVDNGSLLAEMVTNHVNYYNRRNTKDKVFLMTAYLVQYNNRNRGMLTVPISQYVIPRFWENSSLLEKGKKAAPTLNIGELVFKPNYIEDSYKSCQAARPRGPKGVVLGPDNCTPQKQSREALRKQIIDEHKEKLLSYEEYGMTLKLERIRNGINLSGGSGKIANLDALAYNNYIKDSKIPTNGFYALKNGGWVYRSNQPMSTNGGVPNTEPSLNYDDYYYYMYNDETKKWHELLLPATGVSVNSDPYLVKAFWQGMASVARYATPFEDVIILIDGKDFEGNEASQGEAGVWLVAGFVPGGKLLKPVAKITKGGLKIAAKMVRVGNKTIKLSYSTVNGLVEFGGKSRFREIVGAVSGEEAHHIIPWAQRFEDVVQKAAEWGFHMNDKLNGVALKKFFQGVGGVHANHPNYNTYVQKRFNLWRNDNPNFTGKQAREFLENELIPELLNLIDDAKDSGKTLNEYFKNL